jgi:hypothetical protein
MFVTSEGRPGARLQRALAARNLTSAEQAAFEIAFISLERARELVELYAEKGDPKYERVALKYLARYTAEAEASSSSSNSPRISRPRSVSTAATSAASASVGFDRPQSANAAVTNAAAETSSSRATTRLRRHPRVSRSPVFADFRPRLVVADTLGEKHAATHASGRSRSGAVRRRRPGLRSRLSDGGEALAERPGLDAQIVATVGHIRVLCTRGDRLRHPTSSPPTFRGRSA